MLAKTPVRGAERASTTARVEAPPVRHVTMVVDPRSARVAHGEIARRLGEAGVQVCVAHGRQSDDLPASIAADEKRRLCKSLVEESLKHAIEFRGKSRRKS